MNEVFLYKLKLIFFIARFLYLFKATFTRTLVTLWLCSPTESGKCWMDVHIHIHTHTHTNKDTHTRTHTHTHTKTHEHTHTHTHTHTFIYILLVNKMASFIN